MPTKKSTKKAQPKPTTVPERVTEMVVLPMCSATRDGRPCDLRMHSEGMHEAQGDQPGVTLRWE